MVFNPVDLIVAKRNGKTLRKEQIHALIDAYTQDLVPDYQMSAFLMAAFLQGMNADETAALTESMLYSGEVMDLSEIQGLKVDKHSTGGVGDKVSLLLAPIVAACGVPVPMISGRGLGHSGGTLDKLESIPGLRVNLDIQQYKRQLADIGIVMIGQTEEIAPADKRLYALRDVTGTVENVSFIAPSIMSKKLAEGIDALVLDVKCGAGAFMKTEKEARLLAETLVSIGEGFGKPTIAWLTDMEQPLGKAVGNWPEVEESIRCLQGAHVHDLMTLTLTLAGEMLFLGKQVKTPKEGYEIAFEAVHSGKALEKMAEMVRAQGGDTAVIFDPSIRASATYEHHVAAPENCGAFVTGINAYDIGKAAVSLGAGRVRKEDTVDPTAGLWLKKKVGDTVMAGEIIATLHTSQVPDLQLIGDQVRQAFAFGVQKPESRSLLMDRFTKDGWLNRLHQ